MSVDITKHARERWAERFRHHGDMEKAIQEARRPTRWERDTILLYAGNRALINDSLDAIFILDNNADRVVTVIWLSAAIARRTQLKRKHRSNRKYRRMRP